MKRLIRRSASALSDATRVLCFKTGGGYFCWLWLNPVEGKHTLKAVLPSYDSALFDKVAVSVGSAAL